MARAGRTFSYKGLFYSIILVSVCLLGSPELSDPCRQFAPQMSQLCQSTPFEPRLEEQVGCLPKANFSQANFPRKTHLNV